MAGEVNFVRAHIDQLTEIMEIVAEAQEYFRKSGIDQWQNGYPNEEIIAGDIQAGNSYVLISGGRIIATAALTFGDDPNYTEIVDGTWLSPGPYGALHRIALRGEYKGQGLSSRILAEMTEICLERGVYSLRSDTHRDNTSMQRMLDKNGFKLCGVIHLADGSPRLAFEKMLNRKGRG